MDVTHDVSSEIGGSMASGDTDEEMDWEEVAVPDNAAAAATASLYVSESRNIEVPMEDVSQGNTFDQKPKTLEITLSKGQRAEVMAKRKELSKAIHAERVIRLNCHKIHTIALLANALTRNQWINDPLLQARLMSLTPLPLQNAFSMINKKRQPDAAKRGRLFESSVMRLAQWWYETFEVSNFGHIRSRTFNQVQNALKSNFDDEDEGEIIRSSKSLMKHALNQRGCRDTSAQLFTALCRAMGIPTRLVVSLQSVPWQANVGRPKPKTKSKAKKGKVKMSFTSEESRTEDDGDGDDDMEEVDIPGTSVAMKEKGKLKNFPGAGQTLSDMKVTPDKGKGKAISKPVIKLRGSKSKGQRLGSGTSTPRQRSPGPSIDGHPPTIWTEVFSRPDGRWMPVDPIRYIVNKRKVFEPPAHDKNNRMVYVVAVEEDGYVRDVTPRYAKEYGAKTAKVQLGGKGKKEWWDNVMSTVTRPFRLHRDDVEDEEFEMNQIIEGMPTSVSGFKDHPLYVLERHLKRDQVIFPKVELGKFRGEPVYPRSNVVSLKTADNWMRTGRKVKEGCQALKWTKQRAVTIHKRRVLEMAQQDGEEVMQGLYSETQTELYRPDPIVDGKIPKNDFGNIDLYVPSMLPAGAVHVPYKGTAKIARQLGYDYAEAVTSFEFKKGRAFPIVTGIVIAAENEAAFLEAFREHEQNAEEKESAKRLERVIKRWTRLVQGLRIRQRLQEQYVDQDPSPILTGPAGQGEAEPEQAGGFLTDADAVVQPFHLPKYQHGTYEPAGISGIPLQLAEAEGKAGINVAAPSTVEPLVMETVGDDEDEKDGLEEVVSTTRLDLPNGGQPKTMRELAEAAAEKQDQELQAHEQPLATGTATPAQNSDAAAGRKTGTARSLRQKSGTPSTQTGTPISVSSAKRRARKRTRGRHSTSPSSTGDEDIDDTGPSPSKKRSIATTTTPPATRVLRSRVGKSEEALRREREAEAAFRKAIAE